MKQALGKGLDALLGNKLNNLTNDEKERNQSEISISKIIPNRYQPRKKFDDSEFKELVASVKEVGILQPIIVSKLSSDKYEIIAGERRFRAAVEIGMKKIPAIVRTNISDKEMLLFALIENIQREDINPIEEAKSYMQLQDEFSLTHEEIAKNLGKSRTTITNTIRLLNLPLEIQNAIIEKKITQGHARALLSIEDSETQLYYLKLILDNGLSVREIENIVKKKKIKRSSSQKTGELNPVIDHIQSKLREHLGVKVSISVSKKNKKKGKIEIFFNNENEFENIIENIAGNYE